MKFWDHQHNARAETRRLLLGFAFAVVVLVAAVHAALALAWWLMVAVLPVHLPFPQGFLAANVGVSLMLVLGGWWLETSNLRAGGVRLAQRIGAREARPATSHAEQRLFAFSVAMPASALDIKFAEIHPAGYPTVVAEQNMGKKLEQASNGDITFKMFAGGVLGSEKEVIEQAQIGAVQMTRVSLGIVGPVVGMMGTLQALETIKLLSGMATPRNTLRLFDARTSNWRALALQRAQGCPVCGGQHASVV